MIEAIKFEYTTQALPKIVPDMKNLRLFEWEGDFASQLPTNFPPRELCCIILYGGLQQLWNDYKYLPNLKIMELHSLENLALMHNFDGLPFLERFKLYDSLNLEEVDASIGRLERLVCLCIEGCPFIKKFPSITRLKKLETLSFRNSPTPFELSEIQQKMDNLPDDLDLDDSGETQVKKPREDLIDVECCLPQNNINCIRFKFSHKALRKLVLNFCKLGDKDINHSVWELLLRLRP